VVAIAIAIFISSCKSLPKKLCHQSLELKLRAQENLQTLLQGSVINGLYQERRSLRRDLVESASKFQPPIAIPVAQFLLNLIQNRSTSDFGLWVPLALEPPSAVASQLRFALNATIPSIACNRSTTWWIN
jgi:hypothetical protein